MNTISTNVRVCLIPVFALFILITGCDREEIEVSIDDLYWSAYRNPETFDSYLDTTVIDAKASNCFLRYSDQMFNFEQEKLLECGLILQGSPPWNECHDAAESFHNSGVILNNIAGAIDGPVRFDETQGYGFLVIAKSVFTDIDWNLFIDQLDEVTPPFLCKYKGDREWFWE